MKATARYLQRPITLREPKSSHAFTDGSCSCADAWSMAEQRRVARLRAAAEKGAQQEAARAEEGIDGGMSLLDAWSKAEADAAATDAPL
eukprot:5161153-Prymnesium_polylepis.1